MAEQHRISNETLAILKFVENNPGCTMRDVMLGLQCSSDQASSSLSSLFKGRYISRRHGDAKNSRNMRVFCYTLKNIHPRLRRRRVVGENPKQGKIVYADRPVKPVPDILIVVPVKKDETLMLTLGEARALADNLSSFLSA